MGTDFGVKDRKDDVRLTTGLAKLIEEDPALALEHRPEFGEMRLFGQGEMHLRVALERLAGRYGVNVDSGAIQIGVADGEHYEKLSYPKIYMKDFFDFLFNIKVFCKKLLTRHGDSIAG